MIFIGKVFWSIAVVGAEFLVAMALQRAIIAPTKTRKAGGVIVFVMLAIFCVSNVERGVHAMYPTVFKSDAQQLKDLAKLAGTQATDITAAASTAISSIPEQMATARTDLAKLEAELKLISASDGTETSIKNAQRHLQGLNYYDGDIDGRWEELTKAAVQRRGSEIRTDLELKRSVIKGLETGVPVTATATASNDASESKIENDAKARKREAFGNQVTLGAWTLEGARSLGWIVFLSALTMGAVSSVSRRQEELLEAEHQLALSTLKAGRAAPAPPVVAEAPPAPEPAPEPVPEPVETVSAPVAPVEPELPPVDQGSRKGGKNTSFKKAAAKAAKNRVLILADRSGAQVMKVAAE